MTTLLQRLYSFVTGRGFHGSADYWQDRYRRQETSGSGSYGRLAEFKARVLNDIVTTQNFTSVIELGSGDGSQLGLAKYPSYLGVDISPTALENCRARYAGDDSKTFLVLDRFRAERPTADLVLSLDVIYHLVEDEAFEAHMRDLFGAARRMVVIYSSNKPRFSPTPHVRHRKFSDWPERHATNWRLARVIPNAYPFSWLNRSQTSFADFYIYEPVKPK
jgi:SAM-dependent methyltransferase